MSLTLFHIAVYHCVSLSMMSLTLSHIAIYHCVSLSMVSLALQDVPHSLQCVLISIVCLNLSDVSPLFTVQHLYPLLLSPSSHLCRSVFHPPPPNADFLIRSADNLAVSY